MGVRLKEIGLSRDGTTPSILLGPKRLRWMKHWERVPFDLLLFL